jgi:acetyl esterase/lipase
MTNVYVSGCNPNYQCCNDICLGTPTNGYPSANTLTGGNICACIVPYDPNGNIIDWIGKYGTDDRQKYFVYKPKNMNANSPIVVLVHGGAWYSGPSPSGVYGYPFKFAQKEVDSNYVNDLLDNGYVVISILYRLVRVGNTLPEIVTNPVGWLDQVSDINSAILHIKNNFPTCLNLNANSIQIVGESAGAHLSLLWSYMNANPTYVKSVVSMYAPTNMQQYTEYMRTLYAGTAYENHTCGGTLTYDHFNLFLCQPKGSFLFRYLVFDSLDTYSSYNVSAFNCHSPVHKYCLLGNVTTVQLYPSFKVFLAYNLLQSCIQQTITSPLTDTKLLTLSPFQALNNGTIIPTFIMHGESDILVPYNSATQNMSTALSNRGGLINTLVNLGDIVPSNYTSYTSKHLIKTYDDANHSWVVGDGNNAATDVVFYKVRHESINCLNGHK